MTRYDCVFNALDSAKRDNMMMRAICLLGCLTGLLPSAVADSPPGFEFSRKDAWNGFARYHFKVADRGAYVVAPKTAAHGNPWVWRARFPGYHAEMDVKLVARGFHIGYVDVAGMFGSPRAVEIGDQFYEFVTTKVGLAERPALEGVSRGGLFVYNWAARHPEKVACIYCDTPVLDFASWPGGKGNGIGSAGAWKQCLLAYGLDEAQALKLDARPVNHAVVIAKAGIPLLHIVSETDRVVPPVENTYLLQKRLADLKHELQVISVAEGTAKSNGHHFDHPAVDRVTDFIASHAAVRRQWGSVSQIVAHRGSSIDRPECTLASTLRAIEVGATAVEVDVRTTSDGHLVILHDTTLDRTTSGTGSVNEKTLAEVRQLDAGSWFDPKFNKELVPTLKEVLNVSRGRIDVLLDLKESGDEYDRKVASLVLSEGDAARTIVGVRSVEQAQRFRKLLPAARQLGLMAKPDEIEAYAEAGVEMIRLWPRWLTDESLIGRVRKAGAKLHLNGTSGTVEETAPLFAHKPDSLSSDHPQKLIDTLELLTKNPPRD